MTRHLIAVVAALAGAAVPVVVLSTIGLGGRPVAADDHFTVPASEAAVPSGAESGASAVPVYSRSAYDITKLTDAQKAPLIATLTPEQRRITQNDGTEQAFCGTLLDNKKDGTYCCVVCGLPLFSSEDKFDSGTGWPSFFTTYDPAHVIGKEDRSYGMVRTEIECARCDAHLGHVFEDGPQPTGLRFCLNSESLVFYETGETRPAASRPVATETAYFAGGCFWGIEHYFQKGPGVINVVSGYQQGDTSEPAYKEVVTGATGHAETVKVVYDPNVITYRTLLEAFFLMHDPTQVNRQGPDIGTQYRSGIWATSEKQLAEAQAFVAEQATSLRFNRPIATQIEMAKNFYVAEEMHQDFIERTGRRCNVTDPWPRIAKLLEKQGTQTEAAGQTSG